MDEVTPEATEGSDSSNKLECAVCLQPCIQPVELPCHHIFCYLCVKGVTQQSKRCAMCRQEIPLNYLDNPQLIAVEQPTVAFEGSYQWFYEGRNGWWQYDNRTSLEIEAAFKKGEPQCEVLIAGFLYIIDFQKNIQFRRCDPSRRRSIKRDLMTIPKKGIAGIRLPPESDILPSSSSDDSEAVCSSSGSSSSDDSIITVQTRLVLVPKPKVKLAVKKPKAAPSHPKVSKMVTDAIISLKERGGSSLQAIKKHISSCHRVVINRLTPFIKKFLKSSVDNGTLIQTKGKGARGSFKLSASGLKTKDGIKIKKTTKENLAIKKPKALHWKVSEMVNDAIISLKNRRGSSVQAIKKHIGTFHKVNIIRLSPFIKKYLKSAIESGTLIQTKGRGACGSFKLQASDKINKDGAKMKKPKKENTSTKEGKTVKKKCATLKFAKATKMRKLAGYQKKAVAKKMPKPKSFARKVSKVIKISKS